MSTTSWLHRRALEWGADARGDYWNHDALAPWVLVGDDVRYDDQPPPSSRANRGNSDPEVVGVPTQISHLSYLSVSILVATLAHNLRRLIIERMRDGDIDVSTCCSCRVDDDLSSDSIGDPASCYKPIFIAVAIPEGIMLPIAISAVHVLNWQLTSTTTTNGRTANADADAKSGFSAVLIPIDPSDAPRRLEHMLNVCRPALILTATDVDRERIDAKWRPVVLNAWELIKPSPVRSKEALSEIVLALEASCVGSSHEAWHRWILKCEAALNDVDVAAPVNDEENRVSHVVFTSGTTGMPKGCISSIRSLRNYIIAKNTSHGITQYSKVLLASSVSFDPCLGDVLATCTTRATLILPKRCDLIERLLSVLQTFEVTHCLCTPTMWSTLSTVPGAGPDAVPCLQVVALGGEDIPPALIQAWGRSGPQQDSEIGCLRLLATYGVTEACVYQTVGEVFTDCVREDRRHTVGYAFDGMFVRICDEASNCTLADAPLSDNGVRVGEVVLYGNQVDGLHGYLRQAVETRRAFVLDEAGRICYRTGDRGYIHPDSSQLVLCGRIDGAEGMIKVNGVRIELGEVEAALRDESFEHPVVVDCLVKVEKNEDTVGVSASLTDLVCFVVLSPVCLVQMGVIRDVPESGCLVPPTLPLFVLLRERCRLKSRLQPSTFIIIPRSPLSPTGKRDRSRTPSLQESVEFSTLTHIDPTMQSVPLREYSPTGALLARILVECLNLLPAQDALLTSTAAYATAGGDSLSATRVVRALYAHHCGVQDSRFLGGAYGQLEEPFTVRSLLTSRSLGDYADWLDENGFRNGASAIHSVENTSERRAGAGGTRFDDDKGKYLYDGLLQAVTLGHDHVAVGFLEIGADPNYCAHNGRLSKVSGRKSRVATFQTSPLHIACLRGNRLLVQKLLERHARYNSPDPSGIFPVHLLAAGKSSAGGYSLTDDLERLECMKLLLTAGAPVQMKDGSEQTVLHCAARSGYVELLRFLMGEFQQFARLDSRKADCFNWRDNWARTPVHWAVLNGNVEALDVLLRMGCSAHPWKPKAILRSSVANESPTEICERLYGSSELGRRILAMLSEHS